MEKNSKEDNLQKLLENFECKLAVENEVLKKKKGILWQLQEQNKKLQQELELLNEDLTSTSLNVQNLKSMLGKIDQKIKWNSKLLEKRTVFNEALEIDQKVLDKQKAALFEFKNVQEKAMKNWTQNISEHAALWEEEMFNHDSTSTSSDLSLQVTNMRKKIQDVDKEIAIAQKEVGNFILIVLIEFKLINFNLSSVYAAMVSNKSFNIGLLLSF